MKKISQAEYIEQNPNSQEPLVAPVMNFNPDHDEQGRFASGGGGGGTGAPAKGSAGDYKPAKTNADLKKEFLAAESAYHQAEYEFRSKPRDTQAKQDFEEAKNGMDTARKAWLAAEESRGGQVGSPFGGNAGKAVEAKGEAIPAPPKGGTSSQPKDKGDGTIRKSAPAKAAEDASTYAQHQDAAKYHADMASKRQAQGDKDGMKAHREAANLHAKAKLQAGGMGKHTKDDLSSRARIASGWAHSLAPKRK